MTTVNVTATIVHTLKYMFMLSNAQRVFFIKWRFASKILCKIALNVIYSLHQTFIAPNFLNKKYFTTKMQVHHSTRTKFIVSMTTCILINKCLTICQISHFEDIYQQTSVKSRNERKGRKNYLFLSAKNADSS